MTLRRRRLGRTGLEVSELAFGGGWVGGVLIHRDEDTRRAALARALEAGINLVDTAPSYGGGESERTLGRLLGSFDRAPSVATKARLDAAALADSAGEIERSLAGSLERLRRDSVDVLQLHNPIAAESDSRHIAADRVLGDVADALDGLRAQGLVRFIGVTGLGEAAAVRRVVASGRFDTAQVYCNMLNPSAGRTMPAAWEGHDFSGVLDACRAADVGVMNIRVFAAGVLAGDRRHGRESPHRRRFRRRPRGAARGRRLRRARRWLRNPRANRLALHAGGGANRDGRRRHGGNPAISNRRWPPPRTDRFPPRRWPGSTRSMPVISASVDGGRRESAGAAARRFASQMRTRRESRSGRALNSRVYSRLRAGNKKHTYACACANGIGNEGTGGVPNGATEISAWSG